MMPESMLIPMCNVQPNHMQPEKKSAPHYLETCSKIGIAFVLLVFFVVLGASFLIGLLPPEMTVSVDETSSVDMAKGEIMSLSIPADPASPLVPENQAVRLFAYVTNLLEPSGFGITRNVNVTVTAVGIHVAGVVSESGDSSYTGTHVRTIRCSPYRKECDRLLILVTSMFATHWDVTVSIDQGASTIQWMGPVRFHWSYTNKEFVTYQLGFRSVLMVLSIGALITLCVAFCRVRGHKHADQKWMIALLIAVILLDNPLFALRMMTPGWFWAFIDSIFTVTFLSLLMLHLLVLFGGFITARRTFLQFYLPRCALLFVFWCLYVATLTIFQFRDPTSTFDEMPAIIPLNIASLIFFLIWVLWYLYTIARILVVCKKDCGRGHDRRIKGRYLMLFIFVNLVVSIFIGGLIIIFFIPMQGSRASYLTLFTLANDYVWCMAIFMAPSNGIVKTSTTWKDARNPKAPSHPGEPSQGELSELEAEAGAPGGYGKMDSVPAPALAEPTVSIAPALPRPPVEIKTTTPAAPALPEDDDF